MANWMPSSFLPLKLGGVLVALIAGVAMFLGFFVPEGFRGRGLSISLVKGMSLFRVLGLGWFGLYCKPSTQKLVSPRYVRSPGRQDTQLREVELERAL